MVGRQSGFVLGAKGRRTGCFGEGNLLVEQNTPGGTWRIIPADVSSWDLTPI